LLITSSASYSSVYESQSFCNQSLVILRGGQNFSNIIELSQLNYDFYLYMEQNHQGSTCTFTGSVGGWFKENAFTPIATPNFTGFSYTINYCAPPYSTNVQCVIASTADCLVDGANLELNLTISAEELLNCELGTPFSYWNVYVTRDSALVDIGRFDGNDSSIYLLQSYKGGSLGFRFPSNLATGTSLIDIANAGGFYSPLKMASYGDFNGDGKRDMVSVLSEDGAAKVYYGGMNNLKESGESICYDESTYRPSLCTSTPKSLTGWEIFGIVVGSLAAVGIAVYTTKTVYSNYDTIRAAIVGICAALPFHHNDEVVPLTGGHLNHDDA
jgi:hypothetical protein